MDPEAAKDQDEIPEGMYRNEDGEIVAKKKWSTPVLTEHDDRAIRSGGNAGAEGASAPSSTTARS